MMCIMFQLYLDSISKEDFNNHSYPIVKFFFDRADVFIGFIC